MKQETKEKLVDLIMFLFIAFIFLVICPYIFSK
jgi:hypothetical protein